MKLYFTQGACSLAPHIALRESGSDFEAVPVDLKAKTVSGGSDYLKINPKGAVPALALDSGDILTENATILQYIADRSGSTELLPESGLTRYRVLEWVTYISTEIHKGFGPLWHPGSAPEAKEAARQVLGKKFDFLEGHLTEGAFLTGKNFTIADAYLFTVTRWTRIHDIDLERWSGLSDYQERAAARPMVRDALEAEGLA